MKKYIILLFLAFLSYAGYAQKILQNTSEYGITLISTTAIDTDLDHNLGLFIQKYSVDNEVEYYICAQAGVNDVCNFPADAKILFKKKDNSVVELTSLYSEVTQQGNNKYQPTAFYPISQKDLVSLFEGITKIRVAVATIDKNGNISTDYLDKEFKKDKLGAALKKCYELVESTTAKANRSASDDF